MTRLSTPPAPDPTAAEAARRLPVPESRGPVSACVLQALLTNAPGLGDATELAAAAVREPAGGDLLRDEDLQLTLFCLQELHYRGIEGVDDGWEWQPSAVALRRLLEDALETYLRQHVPDVTLPPPHAQAVATALFELTSGDTGPSVARFAARRADLAQLRELVVHKSVYQLKEADPHTWLVPRIGGRAKAALVEVQTDEYGGGRLAAMHSELFRVSMRALGLDDSYGRYVDHAPAVTLAASTFMSMCGLNRRLRGAIAGHLAAFEMTSSIPNRLYGDGLRRHGFDAQATRYFDEHVEADAVHEQIAGRDLAGGLAEAEPALVGDIVFGASACLFLDGLAARDLLDAWAAGRSSLRTPLS